MGRGGPANPPPPLLSSSTTPLPPSYKRRLVPNVRPQVLMQHCRSDSAQVMRQVLKALITVSSRAESQEPLLQAPHLDTVKAVVQSHRPDCVRDALQVLFNVCAKEQHRDKVYQEAFVAELIPLLDEAKLPDIFSERQTVWTAAGRPSRSAGVSRRSCL